MRKKTLCMPTSSLSQTLSVTTTSPPSHDLKRRSNGRFAKATKRTSNKMALMKQGFRNYMAKGNWVLKTQPTKTNHPLNATQGLLMYARRWLFIFRQSLLKYQARVYCNYWKNQISMLMLVPGRSRRKRGSSSPWNSCKWPWHFSETSPKLHSHCQSGKCMYIFWKKLTGMDFA